MEKLPFMGNEPEVYKAIYEGDHEEVKIVENVDNRD